MDWFLSFLVVITNILLARKIKWGWVISFIDSFLWIAYALSLDPPQYGLIPASVFLIFTSLEGIRVWFNIDVSKLRDLLKKIWDNSEYGNL